MPSVWTGARLIPYRIGLLVPIIKKANIDPALPKNYRPITISVVLSKLLEHYVLEKCSHHEYSKFQFGFVPGRNTTMATSFVHDICEYCTAVGSTVFLCSLDTERAYDGIPHLVLFDCARNILPDDCWRILYNWYTDMSVHVKWQNNLGSPIPVQKGIRQGGMTSPLLFNIFYQKLVDKLSECESGIIISGHKYNVFCYAEDLLLTSTTTTGLQTLIDTAVSHVEDRGLKFNPTKTVCMRYGDNPFKLDPSWNISGVQLKVQDHIKYLGTDISYKGSQT